MSSQAPQPNVAEQEKQQIMQLDSMFIYAFKTQNAPLDVREKWDSFLTAMKAWKGIE
jgi:hypothetical protein